MKNIELTEEHSFKLLKMCKELFPEYKVINFTKFNDYSDNTGEGGKINIDNILVFFKDKNAWNEKYQYFNEEFTPNLCTHWFEFCITEIVNELAWRNIKTDILADCEYEDFRMKLITEIFRDKFTTEKFHIVDYLYEEFKKLK